MFGEVDVVDSVLLERALCFNFGSSSLTALRG